jgi:SepF-like predicted cell division protein (DUF552 family)
MGLMSTILGESNGTRQTTDYVELSAEQFAVDETGAERNVHIAQIGEKSDVVDIKDAIYDGDIVIADIIRHSTQDREMQHIIDELKQVTKEVEGDIVQKDDDQLLITPTGVQVSRNRL